MYSVGQVVIERRQGSSPGSAVVIRKTRVQAVDERGRVETETGNIYTPEGLAVDRHSRAWGSIRDAAHVDRRGQN